VNETGEGAGVLVLESKEHTVRRNAKIHAEIARFALTSEGYNIMAPMKDGAWHKRLNWLLRIPG
jgi:3-oxoacyl-[acyl-carrier-protein] synthase II